MLCLTRQRGTAKTTNLASLTTNHASLTTNLAAKITDMITRCYLEITNVCNLNCVFCPKTTRPKHTMTMEQFDTLTTRLMGEVKFLYFHLMGEPFLHPLLPQFVLMAREKGFVPVITTNGTLMTQRADMLEALPHKLQISLHSHEGNGKANLGQYIDEVMAFAKEAARRGCVVVLRLWNEGGHNLMNETILRLMAEHQPRPWVERHDGWKLTDNLFLENDNMFEWPDLQHNPPCRGGGVLLCSAQPDRRACRRHRCALLS